MHITRERMYIVIGAIEAAAAVYFLAEGQLLMTFIMAAFATYMLLD